MNETESGRSRWAVAAVARSGVAPRLRLHWHRALVAPGIERTAATVIGKVIRFHHTSSTCNASKRTEKRNQCTKKPPKTGGFSMAGPTGLEPATSSVTGTRSNQLSYGPTATLMSKFIFVKSLVIFPIVVMCSRICLSFNCFSQRSPTALKLRRINYLSNHSSLSLAGALALYQERMFFGSFEMR